MKEYLNRKIFLLKEASKSKTIVFIISSMRSGSTLLKSLLANAPDTSHLPETDFQKYNRKNAWKINALSSASIIVLKKPANYNDFGYPQIPNIKNPKKIILVRDAYETVLSLKKMNEKAYPNLDKQWNLSRLLNEYWYTTYQQILDRIDLQESNTHLIRYEDLLTSPIQCTSSLFQFIGSRQQSGVETYPPPDSYDWSWGKDDGGQVIKTLKVQNIPAERTNQVLFELIQRSDLVNELRSKLGYL